MLLRYDSLIDGATLPEVRYLKVSDLVWIKGIFWVDWNDLSSTENIRIMKEKIEVETGLHVHGVAGLPANPMLASHPGIHLLRPLVLDMIWLQIPTDAQTPPCIYQAKEEENGAFSMQTLCLGYFILSRAVFVVHCP